MSDAAGIDVSQMQIQPECRTRAVFIDEPRRLIELLTQIDKAGKL